MKRFVTSAAFAGALALSTTAFADTITVTIGDKDCFGGLGGAAPAPCDSSALLPSTIGTNVLPGVLPIDGQDFSAPTDPAGQDVIDHNGAYTTTFAVDLTGKTVVSATLSFRTASLELVNTAATPGAPEFFFDGSSLGTYTGANNFGNDIEEHSFDVSAAFAASLGVVSKVFGIVPDASRVADATSIQDAWGLDFAELFLDVEDAIVTPPPGGGGGGGGTVVPVPAGGVLLISALGLLGLSRRRKA